MSAETSAPLDIESIGDQRYQDRASGSARGAILRR
jgi:hypothetical protein